MNILLEALPGEKIPVSEVTKSLKKLWRSGSGAKNTDFRASQMNVILHCGLDTSPDDLRKCFEALLTMGHRYPCRIIVLCPGKEGEAQEELESKIYAQCYIGDRGRQHTCIEAVILSYAPTERDFLENQVSVLLDNDLPTYHWLHRVPVERVKAYGKSFLQRCKRVIYDSTVEPENYAQEVRAVTDSGPVSSRWRDLANSRALPLRQSLGQFFSAFEPAVLVEGLVQVSLKYDRHYRGEAHCLLTWVMERLADCSGEAEFDPQTEITEFKSGEKDSLLMTWSYENDHFMNWRLNLETSSSIMRTRFEQGEQVHPMVMKLLAPSESLGEAFFF